MRRAAFLIGLLLILSVSLSGPSTVYENICFENTTVGTNPNCGKNLTLRLSSGSGRILIENTVKVGANLGIQGKLGIGVQNPAEKLEISGNLRMTSPCGYIYTPPPVSWQIEKFRFQWDKVWVNGDLIVEGTLELLEMPGIEENYAKFGTLLIQWGRVTTGLSGEGVTAPINFPVPFSQKPTVLLTLENPAETSENIWVQAYDVTTTSFRIYVQEDGRGAGSVWNTGVYWIAIGLA